MAGRPKRNADLVVLNTISGRKALRLISDGFTTSDIAKQLNVSKLALLEWLQKPEQHVAVSRARVNGAAAMVDEAKEIADGEKPMMVDGEEIRDVGRDKLRIQTRHWIAERVDRAQWGAQQKEISINLHGLHLDALRAVQRPQAIELLQAVDNSEQHLSEDG